MVNSDQELRSCEVGEFCGFAGFVQFVGFVGFVGF
jgi:hypothetical protein